MIKIFKFNGYGFFIGKSLEECIDKAIEKTGATQDEIMNSICSIAKNKEEKDNVIKQLQKTKIVNLQFNLN